MIVSAGYNIAGPEVEAALLAHAEVARMRGDRRRRRGARPDRAGARRARRGRRARTPATVKRLQDHVKATIAPYKYPRSVVFADALPKTATGKIQRFALRAAAKVDA